MPKKSKKLGNRISYDVSRVLLSNLEPPVLTTSERKDISKAFSPHTPSDKFLREYERAVRFFVWDVEEVKKVTPSKVSARIKDGIHKNAQQLLSDLLSLEITDLCLLDRHFTTQFLQNRKCVSVNEFISSLTLFMENVAEAMRLLDGVQKSGRMPAFAEQGLALNIGRAIQEETGKLPMLTRNGVFSRVLRCALKDRLDVMDLMRHARDAMTSA